MIFRGEQYANAIEFYHKETQQYPLELKVLMQRGPHRHRYIRRLWKDPLSKDGKWGLLYLSPTGKGFINPYATRRDQQQLIAGAFGDAGPGGGLADAADAGDGGDGGNSSFGRRGSALPGNSRSGRSGLGTAGGDGEEKSGYSEPLPDNFNLRGGEATGLPIVGVVHKKKETGLKIYKNIANINDWAFTLLAEGQDLRMGGSVLPTQTPTRNFGIGDSHTPIFMNPGDRPDAPKGVRGRRNPIQESLDRMRKAREEEEAKRKKEEADQKDGEEDTSADDQDQDPNADENPPPDDQDPNAPHDPNAPSTPPDPNGSGGLTLIGSVLSTHCLDTGHCHASWLEAAPDTVV